jgi:hypothetical protein
MICEQIDDIMLRMIHGEAEIAEQEMFERHLPRCKRCQQEWIAFQDASAVFKGLASQPEHVLPPVDIPQGMVEASLKAYDQWHAQKNALRTKKSRKRILYPLMSGLIAASAFVLWMQNGGLEQLQPEQAVEQAINAPKGSSNLQAGSSLSYRNQTESAEGTAMSREEMNAQSESTQIADEAETATASTTPQTIVSEPIPETTKGIAIQTQQPIAKQSPTNSNTVMPLLKSTLAPQVSAKSALAIATPHVNVQVTWMESLMQDSSDQKQITQPMSAPTADASIQEMQMAGIQQTDQMDTVETKSVMAKPQIEAVAVQTQSFADGKYKLVLQNGNLIVLDQQEQVLSRSNSKYGLNAQLGTLAWDVATGTLHYEVIDADKRIHGNVTITQVP